MAISLCGGVLSTSGYYRTGRRRPYGVPVPPYGRRPCVVCEAIETTEPDHEAQRLAFLAARRRDARDAETAGLMVTISHPGVGWRAECVTQAAREEVAIRLRVKVGERGRLEALCDQAEDRGVAAAAD